jgi:hypothetical protein
MSDFLTNLAARTVAAPTLRPRTRSRFEPAAAEPLPMLPAETMPSPRAPRAIEEPLATHEAFRHPERSEGPGGAGGAQALPPSPLATLETTKERPPVEPAREDAPPAATPSVERREVILPRIEQQLADDPLPPPNTNATIPTPTVTLHHRFDREPPRVERRVETRHSVETTTLLRERISRVGSVRREVAAIQAASAAAEPVVHVSIGRVEVRAVTPQPPARRAAPRPPSLTLDDYVARRDGKGRR